jgi:hypothetical protein
MSSASLEPTAAVLGWIVLGVEIERGLRAGEVPERLGASHVQRLGRAEGLLDCCVVRDGAVEVEGVGDVEVGLEVQGAGVVHVVGVNGDVARVDVLPSVFGVLRGVGGGEVVPLDGLGEEAVELRLPDPPGHGGDLGVDEPRRLGREGRSRVDGGLRNRTGPPRRDPAGVDLLPQPGEAVAQLEGVADELLRRGGGDPEDGAELGETELRDQGSPFAGDGLLVLTPRNRERGGVVDGLRWVQIGPPGSEDELAGGLGVLEVAGGFDRAKQLRGREVVCDLSRLGCHSVDHVTCISA